MMKEPEVTANAHTVAATPDKPAAISWLGSSAGLGLGEPGFGTSLRLNLLKISS
jgi:hypothetical protein